MLFSIDEELHRKNVQCVTKFFFLLRQLNLFLYIVLRDKLTEKRGGEANIKNQHSPKYCMQQRKCWQIYNFFTQVEQKYQASPFHISLVTSKLCLLTCLDILPIPSALSVNNLWNKTNSVAQLIHSECTPSLTLSALKILYIFPWVWPWRRFCN